EQRRDEYVDSHRRVAQAPLWSETEWQRRSAIGGRLLSRHVGPIGRVLEQLHIKPAGILRHDLSRSIPPEPLEVVKLSLLGIEHVRDDINIVEKHPLPVIGPLRMPGPLIALLADRFANSVGNGLDLQLGITGANNEKVGHATYLAHVQDRDIMGLLVEHGI